MTTSNARERKKPSRSAKRQIFIITAAQNATPVHKNTWATLKIMAEYYGQYYKTEIKAIGTRYKNPTSFWSKNNEDDEWWDEAVVPYLLTDRRLLNSRLMVLGDMKVEWASNRPLQGLDALTKDKSGIVGHPNRALRSIATPQHKQPKVMFTTGACTVANYTDTKRGQIGEFNHCLGALIVEIEDETFFVRELNADEHGCIIDLDMEFCPTGWRPAKRAQVLVTGDIHERWKCAEVIRATFDAKDSIMNLVRPRYLFLHDLLDFHSRNHHHKDDWLIPYGKHKFGIENVKKEVDDAIRFVNRVTPDDCKTRIVSSNHDRAMTRWIKDRQYDFRNDPENARFYIELIGPIMDGTSRSKGGIQIPDALITYAKNRVGKNIRFLKQSESFVVGNVEQALHGDKAAGGARGTTANLSTIGVKVNKGHSHTAEIVGGCYSAGTSANRMEYEQGEPSSHAHAHILQYSNGKRTIIFIVNGRYCLPRPKPSTKE